MRRERLRVHHVVEVLRQTRGMIATAAENLGCTRQGLYGFIEKHQLEGVVEEARERVGDFIESRFLKLVEEGNERAIIFGVRTFCASRGYVERLEHTGTLQLGSVNSWEDIAAAGVTREQALEDTMRLFGSTAVVGYEPGLNGSNGKNKPVH